MAGPSAPRSVRRPAPSRCRLRPGGRVRATALGGRRHARAVARVDQRAEQGDAEGAAEFTHRVVQRRGDALLLGRQRLGDRCGRRAHQEADADAEHHQARQERQVAAVDGHHRGEHDEAGAEDRASRRSAPERCRTSWRASGATDDSGIIIAAIGSSPADAFSAEKPSTACRNWMSTRKMPNITAKTRNRLSDPAASERLRNNRMSNSGLSMRSLVPDEGGERDAR